MKYESLNSFCILLPLGQYQKVSSKKVVFAMLRTGSIELYYCVLKEKHFKRETSWSRLLKPRCYLIIVKTSENIALETTLLSWTSKLQ